MFSVPDKGSPAATPKQAAILRAGRSLLLRHGIRKVRVEEICADARVSKRTFYKYYRDKDALAIAVLGALFEEGRTKVEAILTLNCPIEAKVPRIIAAKSELASETSLVFYREALDDATEPGRFALRQQRQWDERVRRFYREAQARGEIRADLDLSVLMALLVRLRELVKDPELVGLVPDLSRLVESVMKLFFYGIIPRPATHLRGAPGKPRRKPA